MRTVKSRLAHLTSKVETVRAAAHMAHCWHIVQHGLHRLRPCLRALLSPSLNGWLLGTDPGVIGAVPRRRRRHAGPEPHRQVRLAQHSLDAQCGLIPVAFRCVASRSFATGSFCTATALRSAFAGRPYAV